MQTENNSKPLATSHCENSGSEMKKQEEDDKSHSPFTKYEH